MAIRTVMQYPRDKFYLLRQTAPVNEEAITTQSSFLRILINDLMETCTAYDGAGIAAPQIGSRLRVFVAHFPIYDEEGNVTGQTDYQEFINPVIEEMGELVPGFDGCLSIGGIFTAESLRPSSIKISYNKLGSNERVSEYMEGMHARIVHHEVDHLNGILFPQRLPNLDSIFAHSGSSPEDTVFYRDAKERFKRLHLEDLRSLVLQLVEVEE